MSPLTQESLKASKLERIGTVAKRRTGKRPSLATQHRWIHKGLKGGAIKLAVIKLGSEWLTTEEAFEDFLIAQTEAALAPAGQAVHDPSDEELKAAGLL